MTKEQLNYFKYSIFWGVLWIVATINLTRAYIKHENTLFYTIVSALDGLVFIYYILSRTPQDDDA